MTEFTSRPRTKNLRFEDESQQLKPVFPTEENVHTRHQPRIQEGFVR